MPIPDNSATRRGLLLLELAGGGIG